MLDVESIWKIYIDLYETADIMMLNGVMPPDRIMGALDYLALVLGNDCPLGYEWRGDFLPALKSGASYFYDPLLAVSR